MASRDRFRWEQEFEQWLAPFLAVLGHTARRRWAHVYLRGLFSTSERKSVQPMAEKLAPDDYEQLHHFVSTSTWDPAPLEAILAEKAQAMLGGADAFLIIDDTPLHKQGRHSVGVARQYSGAAGKTTNCQVLVSLTLASREVPLPLAMRLFLPEAWSSDPAQCARAGVPSERLGHRTKGEIAIEELDRLLGRGVHFGCVLADSGYGSSSDFRRALTDRRLRWAVGISRTQKVYAPTVVVTPPEHLGRRGRPRKHPSVSEAPQSVEDRIAALPEAAWQRVPWRTGTKGALEADFAALRVRVADGPNDARGQHLPGNEAWLVAERRRGGEQKYYLTNHPPETSLKELAALIKARWSCEQAHQQLKEELGLDHYEGRSWGGLHHHVLLAMIAFAFLQHLRLQESGQRGKNAAEPLVTAGASPGAQPAGDSSPATPVRGKDPDVAMSPLPPSLPI